MSHKYTPEQYVRAFWNKVDKSGGDDACWLWTGARLPTGYGRLKVNRKLVSAHRFAYEVTFGIFPQDKLICHRCDNPSCVNPSHLFLGTHGDNMQDMWNKGRSVHQTHPELLARGDDNGSRKHPERLRRGDNHPARLHPEYLARGEKHWHAKFTDAQVRDIRKRYAVGGITQLELAKEFNVHKSTIQRMLSGLRWNGVDD